MTTQLVNYNNKCVGEKGHIQNNWSVVFNNLKKEIEFQIVRSDNYIFLEVKWLEFLSKNYEYESLYKEYGNPSYKYNIKKIIKSTRCIKNGKGEQHLSFVLLFILWNFDKYLAFIIFRSFVIDVCGEVPCGSMKDIKYFCDYIYRKTLNKNHGFINMIMNMSYKICKKEEENYEKNIENNDVKLTLFGKWFPRNKSKRFGWINKKFAKTSFRKGFKTGSIQSQTLNSILNKSEFKNKKIDFLNLDIEGNEINALKSLDLIKYNPKLICVEIHNNTSGRKAKDFLKNNPIYKFLYKKGYKYIWNNEFSYIFMRK